MEPIQPIQPTVIILNRRGSNSVHLGFDDLYSSKKCSNCELRAVCINSYHKLGYVTCDYKFKQYYVKPKRRFGIF